MIDLGKVVGVIVAAVGLVVVIGLVLAFPVMLLWNGCVVPAIDGVNEITWLQAWGIMVVCNFLFKPTLTQSKTEKA